MSQPEDTSQQDPNLMQQNVRQAGDQSNNDNQDVISFPLATPNGGPPYGGNACISGLYGAIDTNQFDTSGRLFFPEAHAAQASDSNVSNSNGTDYQGWPQANNTPGTNGAVAFTCPNPSIMVAAPNGPAPQIGHEPFDFNSYQDATNGQGTFPLDFEQEALNFQGFLPFNSDQAGPSGHGIPAFDADQSGPNGHNHRVVNPDQGENNSQGPVVTNPYQADPKGKGPLALRSDQTSPDSQGFLPANFDQARPSVGDQIASIFDLSQTHVLDNPTLWRPMTVEDIGRNPAATFQYFMNFQNSLQSSHELAIDKVQRDYAIAFEKFRNDHAITLEKARHSYAIAIQEVHLNAEAYCCKLRADMEYLKSDNAAKTRSIRDVRIFVEHLNREMSHRERRLSPTSIHSRPITQASAAGGQMGAQPNAGGQNGTVALKNGNAAEVMNTPGQGHAAQAPAAAGGQMGAQPKANGQTGMVVPNNGNVVGLMNTPEPGHVANVSAAADGPMMLAQSNARNPGGQTRIKIGNGARQSTTPGQPHVAPRSQTPVLAPPPGAPRPLIPGQMLVPSDPSFAIRYAASPPPTNGRNKRTLSEMSPAAPGKKKLAR